MELRTSRLMIFLRQKDKRDKRFSPTKNMSLCSYVLNLIRKGYIHLISHVLINYPFVRHTGTLYRRGVVAINKKTDQNCFWSVVCVYKYASVFTLPRGR